MHLDILSCSGIPGIVISRIEPILLHSSFSQDRLYSRLLSIRYPLTFLLYQVSTSFIQYLRYLKASFLSLKVQPYYVYIASSVRIILYIYLLQPVSVILKVSTYILSRALNTLLITNLQVWYSSLAREQALQGKSAGLSLYLIPFMIFEVLQTLSSPKQPNLQYYKSISTTLQVFWLSVLPVARAIGAGILV